MGVESGGGGGGGREMRPQSKNQRGTSPEIRIFQYFFFLTRIQITFCNIFKQSGRNPSRNLILKVGGLGAYESVLPTQSKLRGDALGVSLSLRFLCYLRPGEV